MIVKAKISGYHPASGLHLEAGETYTINRDHFSKDVFDTEEIVEEAEPNEEEAE